MNRRLLFLDIDGVLNHHKFFEATRGARGALDPKTPLDLALAMLDPAAVRRLDHLLHLGVADVVISSTWRLGYTPQEIAAMLQHVGLHPSRRIVGATDRLGTRRGLEIQAYMDFTRAQATDIVILDDNADMDHLLPRLVQTDARDGLQAEHILKALLLWCSE